MEYIRRSRLFDGMEDDDIRLILQCLGYSIKLFKKDKVIAMEGNNMSYIGIVLQGSVDMIKEDVWGNKDMLTRIMPGDLFGETFACGVEAEAVVTFVASSTTEALILPFTRVISTCSNSCGFHEKLIRNLIYMIAKKNKALMQKLEVVTKKSLREKILAYLSQQAQEQQTKYIHVPLGRKELADFLCADRSSLTRELSSMKKERLIDFERNTFRLY
ncbi:MAG: Crp/Fnr family transcriptional regulator [Eubacterium sp.]|nr:Crp/Fnr family transcriptional regulator [Eubacterium sp.]